MLEDGTVNCEKTSGDCIILPANLVNNKKSPIDEADGFEYQEEVYTISSLETVNAERCVRKDSYFKSYFFYLFFTQIILAGYNKIHVIWMS